jgi:hypothetical protein
MGFTVSAYTETFFSRKRRRAAHHYIKKIKMGQEPIQNNTKPHTQL